MEHSLPTNNILIRIWRLLSLLCLVSGALLVMIFCYPFMAQNKRMECLRTWSKRMTAIFALEVTVKGDVPDSFEGLLLMANHVSWLDIFALNFVHPVCFVAKMEIKKWPILGGMVARAGTVFIDRADKKDAVRISQNIATRLQEGGTVALFPESTTTDGFRLLPLKAALFESAIIAKSPVQAVALLYYDENHERSILPSYVGDTSLFESIFIILKRMRKGYIEVVFCPKMDTSNEEDRFDLCNRAQASLENIVYNGLPLITDDGGQAVNDQPLSNNEDLSAKQNAS